MMKQPKDSDFFITLPDVGDFRFNKQTLLDRANIRADYLTLAKGSEDQYLVGLALVLARHCHLCVSAPHGWEDLDNLEITQWHEDKLFELHTLLSAKDESFRNSAGKGVKAQGQGQGISTDLPVLVSEALPVTTN